MADTAAIVAQIQQSTLEGLASAFTVVFALTLVALPTSYMMNKYIYHAAGFRVVMGLIGAHLGVLFVLLAPVLAVRKVIGSPGIHYFGLFPLLTGKESPMEEPPTGLVDWTWWLFRNVMNVPWMAFSLFNQGTTTDDMKGYEQAIEFLLEPRATGTPLFAEGFTQPVIRGRVHEEFLEACRLAATERIPKNWRQQMAQLEESQIGKILFATPAVAAAGLQTLRSAEKEVAPELPSLPNAE